MALVSSLELNDILALGGSTGHSDQDGPGGGMVPDTNKATGCGPNSGLRVTFGGNMSLRFQHSPWQW